MRFKIDENLPVEAADVLQAAGHEATTIHDEQLVGQPDPNVAQVCRDEWRALVTLDLDFSDIRTYPPDQYRGLIVLRPRRQAKPLVLALLQGVVVPLLASERVDGCLWIVDERGVRIREGGSIGAPCPQHDAALQILTSREMLEAWSQAAGLPLRAVFSCPLAS